MPVPQWGDTVRCHADQVVLDLDIACQHRNTNSTDPVCGDDIAQWARSANDWTIGFPQHNALGVRTWRAVGIDAQVVGVDSEVIGT